MAAQAATSVAEKAAPEASGLIRALQPKGVRKQRFFPQCGECSQEQSTALRMDVKRLKAHFGGVQPFAYSGPLVRSPRTPVVISSILDEKWKR